MIDETAAILAMRQRLTGLSVVTTGSINTLSTTALGFSRSSGSFITDGFQIGMEVKPQGFSAANNTYCVIKDVTTSFLTIDGGRTAAGVSTARSIVCGLPEGRAWENVEFDPTANRPYIADQWVPGTSTVLTLPAPTGTMEETGLYVITYYGLKDKNVKAIRDVVGAIKALFAPGTTITVGSDVLRVRSDTATQSGQIIPLDTYAACTIKVPWRCTSVNAVV